LRFNLTGMSLTASSFVSQLIAVLTTALGISSSRLTVTIVSGTLRAADEAVAQVTFLNAASDTADQVYTRFEAQMKNSSSSIRQANITSSLSQSSIENVVRVYTCASGTQSTPCSRATTRSVTLLSWAFSFLMISMMHSTI
jgi:hypothetical protein